MKRWLYIVIAMLAPMTIWANTDSLSIAKSEAQQEFDTTINRVADDFIKASILLEEQGYYLFSTLGHIALRLRCPAYGLDYVFSYEGEQVSDRITRTMRGKLYMRLYAVPAEEYIRDSEVQKLGLTEYELMLTPQQKLRLWKIVDAKMSEDKPVKYDLFYHGCAGSVRDWVMEALDEDTICYCRPMCTNGLHVSDIFLKYTESDWAQFAVATLAGGNLVYGDGLTDVERLVAPRDLVHEWQCATVNGRPLLAGDGQPLAEYVPVRKCWFSPIVLALLLMTLAIISWFTTKTYLDWVVTGVYALIGTVIWGMCILHPIHVTGTTWLMIVYHPLLLLAWRWKRYWSLLFVLIAGGWMVFLAFYPHHVTTIAHILIAGAFMFVLLKPYMQKWLLKQSE